MSHGFEPTRLRHVSKTLIDETDPTGTTRAALYVGNHPLLSLQIEHGALTGTLTLHGSNRESPSTANDDDWIEVDSSEVTLTDPAGSSGDELKNMSDLAHRWIMVKYVHSSGTGDLFVAATAKA